MKETNLQFAFEHLQTNSQSSTGKVKCNQKPDCSLTDQVTNWPKRPQILRRAAIQQIDNLLEANTLAINESDVLASINFRATTNQPSPGEAGGQARWYKREWHWTFLCLEISWNMPDQDVFGTKSVILCWSCHMTSIHLVLILHQDVCGSEPQFWCGGPKKNWLNPF